MNTFSLSTVNIQFGMNKLYDKNKLKYVIDQIHDECMKKRELLQTYVKYYEKTKMSIDIHKAFFNELSMLFKIYSRIDQVYLEIAANSRYGFEFKIYESEIRSILINTYIESLHKHSFTQIQFENFIQYIMNRINYYYGQR